MISYTYSACRVQRQTNQGLVIRGLHWYWGPDAKSLWSEPFKLCCGRDELDWTWARSLALPWTHMQGMVAHSDQTRQSFSQTIYISQSVVFKYRAGHNFTTLLLHWDRDAMGPNANLTGVVRCGTHTQWQRAVMVWNPSGVGLRNQSCAGLHLATPRLTSGRWPNNEKIHHHHFSLC